MMLYRPARIDFLSVIIYVMQRWRVERTSTLTDCMYFFEYQSFVGTKCISSATLEQNNKFFPEGEIYFQPGATPQICMLNN